MVEPAANGTLGLLCGSGALPYTVAEAAASRGRRVVLYAFRGYADPVRVAQWPHHWVSLGEVGRFARLLRQENCREVAMVGGLLRPSLRNVRFDFGTVRAIPTILRAFRGGDDHLISTLGRIFENRGVRIVGLQEIAPQVLTPHGSLTARVPDADARTDISLGLDVLHAIGRFDIGQAAVVIDSHVVGIEGAEGTDGLLARIAALRGAGRIAAQAGRGVLVKAPKPLQDLRFDLPTVGPQTVSGAKAAGLAGIAVAAGRSLMAESQATVRDADVAGLFIVGIDDGATGASR